MAKRLQLRRGTTAEHSTFTGAVGEVTVDTTKDTVVVHDNSTAGGHALALEKNVPNGASSSITDDGTNVGIPQGKLELGNNPLGATEVTIADNSVATITPPKKGGYMIMGTKWNCDYPSGEYRSALIYYDCGASLHISKADLGSGFGTHIDTIVSNLTGVTGTIGRLTVAVQSDVVKVENRRGSSTPFNIVFL